MDPRAAAEARIRDWCVAYFVTEQKMRLEKVDPNARFARLGMDSAMSIFFLSAIEDWLEVQLPAELVFEHQTITALARHLAGDPQVIAALNRRDA
jgi:acyl carrier protein